MKEFNDSIREIINQQTEDLKETTQTILNRIDQLEASEKSRQVQNSIPRTCDELRSYDPSKASGLDMVDPDGPFGDDPIPVFCNMTTGATLVSHDATDGAEVDCTGRACFTQNVQYEASHRQLVALTRLSLECSQSVQFIGNCSDMGDWNDAEHSWWQDRNNVTRTFSNCQSQQSSNLNHCL